MKIQESNNIAASNWNAFQKDKKRNVPICIYMELLNYVH